MLFTCFFQSIRQGRGTLGYYVLHGREVNAVAAVYGRYRFQHSLRSDIRNSGHMHHLRRVFGAIVKLLLTVDESEDQDTMQAILTTMEHSGFRDAAEWLTTGIHTKPCLNCGRFNR